MNLHDFVGHMMKMQERLDELIHNEELFLSDWSMHPAYMLEDAKYIWVRTDAAVEYLKQYAEEYMIPYPEAKGVWYWKTCGCCDMDGVGVWADAEKDHEHLREAIRSLFRQKKEE